MPEVGAVTESAELLHQLTRDLEFALRAEGVSADARERVVSRVLYGEPDAPHRIHHYRTLPYGTVFGFLTDWVEAHRESTAGGPAPAVSVPPCPGCGEPATILTVAAASPGWFMVRPCGCLFDVAPRPIPERDPHSPYLPKETTHGVAITPTLFPPMTRPEPDRTFTRDGRRT